MREPTERPTLMTQDWEPDPSVVTPKMQASLDALGLDPEFLLMDWRNYQIGDRRSNRFWDGKFQNFVLMEIKKGEKERLASVKQNHPSGWYEGQDFAGLTWQMRQNDRFAQREINARLLAEMAAEAAS